MSNSYDAAAQKVRMWLRRADTSLHGFLRVFNKIPISKRRVGLRYARARLLLKEKQEPSFTEALALICDVLKAYYRVDNEGVARLVREATGNAHDREGSILELLEELP